MLLSELLKQIEYDSCFEDCNIDHVTNSSFEARLGSAFVCIKGFATDGHIFAAKAYQNGCRVFVCEYRPKDLPNDANIVLVKDSRRALALISCELYQNPSKEMTVIGITGTKGKTTTALMIKQMLDIAGIPAGYIGSNGIIYDGIRLDATNTTPESYKLQYYMRDMIRHGTKACVMEVSSQSLKLNRVLGIDFDITLFTNLSPDHIGPGEHDNFEDYLLTKKILFDEFNARVVIANADDQYTERMLSDCKSPKLLYSTQKCADIQAKNIEFFRKNDTLGMTFDCIIGDELLPCSIGIPGKFNVHNAVSTIAVAKQIGLSSAAVCDILSSLKIEGRFETFHAPNGACFVIDYAHNGLSLESALLALREYNPKRLICLFGSVGCRTQVRRAQLGAAASQFADFSILTSDNPDTEDPQKIIDDIALQYENGAPYVSIPDRAEAIKYAFDICEDGDIILLAGKGHERYQLIGGKKTYFYERDVVESCMNVLETK